MCKEKRKIVLFIDNCLIPEMKAVEVVFLPPNTTSKLQPLDKGIIRSFKVFYRMELVNKVVDSIDKKQKMKPFNMLDRMRMADRAWMNVTQKTVLKRLVFLVWKVKQMRSRNSTQKHSSVKNGRRFQKSSAFLKRQRLKNLRSSTWRFKRVDCGLMMRSFLKQFLRRRVGTPEEPDITAARGKDAVHILRRFMECSKNVEKEDFGAISRIENSVGKQFEKRCRRSLCWTF
ncbi:hypothetical protein AVEN_54610-1 [Araneus ventricosus]|uniref:DDE-1 domain-containing protein n=1 Tax=Araneus ventricosus TaxID=182803 RepID=A0A4Y2BP44_ARAVE|nr:hypothetical protein AVEN_54610-1 [Araneus ventricosus]